MEQDVPYRGNSDNTAFMLPILYLVPPNRGVKKAIPLPDKEQQVRATARTEATQVPVVLTNYSRKYLLANQWHRQFRTDISAID